MGGCDGGTSQTRSWRDTLARRWAVVGAAASVARVAWHSISTPRHRPSARVRAELVPLPWPPSRATSAIVRYASAKPMLCLSTAAGVIGALILFAPPTLPTNHRPSSAIGVRLSAFSSAHSFVTDRARSARSPPALIGIVPATLRRNAADGAPRCGGRPITAHTSSRVHRQRHAHRVRAVAAEKYRLCRATPAMP